MRKQAVKQAFESNSMEVALEALGRSIARWTDKGRPDHDPNERQALFVCQHCGPHG